MRQNRILGEERLDNELLNYLEREIILGTATEEEETLYENYKWFNIDEIDYELYDRILEKIDSCYSDIDDW